MSNQQTALDTATDAAIEVAVASLLSTFSSNKTSDVSPVLDRVAALRILTKRMIRKNTTNGVRNRAASQSGVSQ
jgi:hypothetical protein